MMEETEAVMHNMRIETERAAKQAEEVWRCVKAKVCPLCGDKLVRTFKPNLLHLIARLTGWAWLARHADAFSSDSTYGCPVGHFHAERHVLATTLDSHWKFTSSEETVTFFERNGVRWP